MIGLPKVLLPDTHLNTTAFLCVEELRLGGAVRVPRATAFFVMDREGDPPHPIWLVTARHNIQEIRFEQARMFVRVNTPEGSFDIPSEPSDWHEDDEHDVAVSYWAGGDSGAVITAVPIDQFVSEDYRYHGSYELPSIHEMGGQPIRVGHEAFFVGLFSQHAGTARNLPIARFGSISGLPSEPVSVGRRDKTVERITGYLVEARSWGGHSGSPVFWYYPAPQVHFVRPPAGAIPGNRAERRARRAPDVVPVTHEGGIIALLGLVSAHFDIPAIADVEGDVLGRVVTRLNSGMALVTPAHHISALLKREDIVAEKDEYRVKHEDAVEPVATFDYIAEDAPEEGTEFERFENLTRKLVNTPKPNKEPESKGGRGE